MKVRNITTAILLLILALSILNGCSGRKPTSEWTAAEYFRYAMETYDDENYYEAVNEFTVVLLRYAGTIYADSAQYYLGMSHFMMDEHIIAAAEFNKLVNDMSRSPLVPDAQYMLAESFYQLSPRSELDQEYTLKAIKEFQIFLEDFPSSPKREEVEKKMLEMRSKLARKQWLNAELYAKMREFTSSLIYYDIVINTFYDSEFADDALLGKARVYLEMEDFEKAKEFMLLFKEKYPSSDLKEEYTETWSEIEKSLQ
jgi:outer membrane protein assembly factor BamD